MTLTPPRPAARTRPPATGSGWFRAVWRWHFFASLVVVPVLLVLASTGLIYLFRFQLEPMMHPDLMRVEQSADVTQPYAAQLAAVERAHPDATVTSMTEAASPGEPGIVHLELPGGGLRDVFVDPWSAQVLGSVDPDTTLSGYAVRLHADLMSGVWGDRLMELGACWALVTALLGYYLFWKGRAARRRRPRSLRSWHARSGAVAGVGLLLLLVSGLPWTGFVGAQAQQLATAGGSSLWSQDHGAVSDPASTLDESLPHSHDVPWGSGKSEVPRSGGGHRAGAGVADVDTALAVADAEGLRHPMTVALPSGPDGVFSVIGYAFDAPSDERTVHVDRYGGDVVSAYGFDDYPALAQVVAQGIGLHEGRSLGLVSFWAAALMCVVVIVSCVTGPVMWWRRRSRGSLGAPRGRMPVAGSPWLLAGLVVLGVLLPFFGITLLAVLLLDRLVLRRVPALGRWFGTT